MHELPVTDREGVSALVPVDAGALIPDVDGLCHTSPEPIGLQMKDGDIIIAEVMLQFGAVGMDMGWRAAVVLNPLV